MQSGRNAHVRLHNERKLLKNTYNDWKRSVDGEESLLHRDVEAERQTDAFKHIR